MFFERFSMFFQMILNYFQHVFRTLFTFISMLGGTEKHFISFAFEFNSNCEALGVLARIAHFELNSNASFQRHFRFVVVVVSFSFLLRFVFVFVSMSFHINYWMLRLSILTAVVSENMISTTLEYLCASKRE